jgi:hypothetical protein
MNPHKRRDSPQHGDRNSDNEPDSDDSDQTIRPDTLHLEDIDERLHLEHWLDQLTIATAKPHIMQNLGREACSIPMAWRIMLGVERRDRLLQYPDLLQRYILQESTIQQLMNDRIHGLEQLAKDHPEGFRRSMSSDGHALHNVRSRVLQELEHLRPLLDRRFKLSGVGYADTLANQMLERKLSQLQAEIASKHCALTSILADISLSMRESAFEKPELRLKMEKLRETERSDDLIVMMAGNDGRSQHPRALGQTEYMGRIYYGDSTEDEMTSPGPLNDDNPVQDVQRRPSAPAASPALSNDPMDSNNNVGNLHLIEERLRCAPRSASDTQIVIQSRFTTPEFTPPNDPFVTSGPRPVIDAAARQQWMDDMRRSTQALQWSAEMMRRSALAATRHEQVLAEEARRDVEYANRIAELAAQWAADVARRETSHERIGLRIHPASSNTRTWYWIYANQKA